MFWIGFGTSHYSFSVAGRAIMAANNINLAFRRWTEGASPLLPVLFNFITCTLIFETVCYKICREKVSLFLEKEQSTQQE